MYLRSLLNPSKGSSLQLASLASLKLRPRPELLQTTESKRAEREREGERALELELELEGHTKRNIKGVRVSLIGHSVCDLMTPFSDRDFSSTLSPASSTQSEDLRPQQ